MTSDSSSPDSLSSDTAAVSERFADCKTVRQTRDEIVKSLDNAGIESAEARKEADLIIEHVLKTTTAERLIGMDETIGSGAKIEIERIVLRRLNREPLQYCLGYGWFMGSQIAVQPGVFIPRTDTEILCQLVSDRLLTIQEQLPPENELRILEIGVGSGCISISLLKQIERLQVVGVDVSETALDTTRLNARTYEVSHRLTLSKCDFREFTLSGFHAIISNPPYIPKAVYETLEPEVKEFEPKTALVGWDEDGLGFYRDFGKFAIPKLIVPHGFAAVEVGDGEADDVAKILRSAGMNRVEIVNDVNDLPRVVVCGIA